jgi:hypothetical protein
MSKVLNTMVCAAIIMLLGLATMGSANARAINHHHRHGYAGSMYSPR